jgi:hypothetical protein
MNFGGMLLIEVIIVFELEYIDLYEIISVKLCAST